MLTRKQRRESDIFKSFRFFAGDAVPDGRVTHTGTFDQSAPDGAPDFLIAGADRVLGIELRELFKVEGSPGSEQAEEGYMDDLLQMAQEFTELRSAARPRVSVLSYGETPSDRPKRRDLARTLSDLVIRNMPKDKDHADICSLELHAAGVRSVERVMIHRDDRLYRSGIWNAPQAGAVLSNCADLFQRAIDTKAGKHEAYRKHCSECWLVLVADTVRPSASIQPAPDDLAHVYHSPFARTYFLDYGMGRLHRLTTVTSD